MEVFLEQAVFFGTVIGNDLQQINRINFDLCSFFPFYSFTGESVTRSNDELATIKVNIITAIATFPTLI